jgi:carboxylate-amine ligase
VDFILHISSTELHDFRKELLLKNLKMKKLPAFTLGVEEEYQIIDPETRDLRSHLSKIVDGAKVILNEQVKAEMHQSVVEVGTNICMNVNEAEKN